VALTLATDAARGVSLGGCGRAHEAVRHITGTARAQKQTARIPHRISVGERAVDRRIAA
jgi:hypothetical protein